MNVNITAQWYLESSVNGIIAGTVTIVPIDTYFALKLFFDKIRHSRINDAQFIELSFLAPFTFRSHRNCACMDFNGETETERERESFRYKLAFSI